jgi:hypothetical protein
VIVNHLPSHRSGILSLLSLPDTHNTTRQQVQGALLAWDSIAFETAAAEAGMCATALRSLEEWDKTEQAKALVGVPPVQIIKIVDSNDAKRDVSLGGKEEDKKNPLDGIRTLDLSRVLAGPTAGRTLAGGSSSSASSSDYVSIILTHYYFFLLIRSSWIGRSAHNLTFPPGPAEPRHRYFQRKTHHSA